MPLHGPPCESVNVPAISQGEGGETHNATRRQQRFRFTEKLVPEPFDVVEPIHNHDIVFAQESLDSRVFICSSLLLGFGFAVDTAWDVERFGVD